MAVECELGSESLIFFLRENILGVNKAVLRSLEADMDVLCSVVELKRGSCSLMSGDNRWHACCLKLESKGNGHKGIHT